MIDNYMAYNFFHNLRGDKMLKFLSYLSVQQENSSFCYRFETCLLYTSDAADD